ncbi:hypothetical protein EIL87_10740 [Saccharopolyspora rhizosphaerae]|uniref:MucR family transcriptional regulator n=1 Tax=Saccharopolyspora rhizosphaerae TaxID=2492662 RepID=A0A3R8R3A7_9PSEU|nr:hypothetical protein [Saccharopolyspora rhizosphaerae]RRO17273.1 hypothetical protein EIL87_10740 [Saccharopolyspora rhizosphaerae]
MFDPNGPLPPAVYWRRRAVAISMSVVVVASLVWGVVALAGRSGEPDAVERKAAGAPGQPVAVAADSSPQACPDEAMRVAAEAGQPEFRVGERIALAGVVTNTSPRPCLRDLNRMLREIEVTTPAGRHVWSSNDCYAESTNEQPVLEPGKPVRNDVLWAGLTSAPGCVARQDRVPPGDYVAVARLTSLTSAPVPFRVVP